MERNKLLELIKERALWRYDGGKFHVQTSESGLHSDLYLNTDYIVSDVTLMEEIVEKIFLEELNSRKIKPDWIITYPPFGLALAYALARHSCAKFCYVDIKKESCNFDVKRNDKVIVVGDDIYSGTSIKKTIEIAKKIGAEIKSPIFTFGNFSGTKELLGIEIFSVLNEKGNLYTKDNCPMCKEKSQPILSRPNWNILVSG